MKPDYKNWVPKGMIAGFAAGAGVALVLFLIFGASFSLLSSEAIESLTELRPYFTALAAICFAASAFYFFKKPKSCDIANRRKKWIFIYVFLAVFVIILLSYPEVLGKIYE